MCSWPPRCTVRAQCRGALWGHACRHGVWTVRCPHVPRTECAEGDSAEGTPYRRRWTNLRPRRARYAPSVRPKSPANVECLLANTNLGTSNKYTAAVRCTNTVGGGQTTLHCMCGMHVQICLQASRQTNRAYVQRPISERLRHSTWDEAHLRCTILDRAQRGDHDQIRWGIRDLGSGGESQGAPLLVSQTGSQAILTGRLRKGKSGHSKHSGNQGTLHHPTFQQAAAGKRVSAFRCDCSRNHHNDLKISAHSLHIQALARDEGPF